MARQNNFKFPAEGVTIQEIYILHHITLNSLNESFKGKIKPELLTPEFIEKHDNDKTDINDWLYREIDLLFSFLIIAFLESRFRIDFIIRTEIKPKEDITYPMIALRQAYDKQPVYQVPINQIINIWIEHTGNKKLKRALNELIKAIDDFRNWFAHGRFYKGKNTFDSYNFNLLYTFAYQIESIIGAKLKHFEKNYVKQLNNFLNLQ